MPTNPIKQFITFFRALAAILIEQAMSGADIVKFESGIFGQ